LDEQIGVFYTNKENTLGIGTKWIEKFEKASIY
jgi:hypothetical protein